MPPLPGDIGLVRIPGLLGWLIQLGELVYDGNWRQSHAFLYLGAGRVLEAQPGGARITTLAEYDGRAVLWSTRQPTDQQRHAIVEVATSLVGVPYGWRDYAALILLRLHIRPGAVRAWVNNGRTLICSQLVDFAWDAAGVHIFDDGRQPGDVTPGDLARAIRDGRL